MHQALTAQAKQIDQHLGGGRKGVASFNNDPHGYALQHAVDSGTP